MTKSVSACHSTWFVWHGETPRKSKIHRSGHYGFTPRDNTYFSKTEYWNPSNKFPHYKFLFYLEDVKQKLAAPRRLYASGHPLLFQELKRLLGERNVATK